MAGAVQALEEIRRVSLETRRDPGSPLEQSLRQLFDIVSTYRSNLALLEGIEPLEAWSLVDQLIERVTRFEERLKSTEFEATLDGMEKAHAKHGRRARALRDRLIPLLAEWHEGLLARRMRIAWAFSSRGLHWMVQALERELNAAPMDLADVERLLARVRAARAGEPVLLGDVPETAARMLLAGVAAAQAEEQACEANHSVPRADDLQSKVREAQSVYVSVPPTFSNAWYAFLAAHGSSEPQEAATIRVVHRLGLSGPLRQPHIEEVDGGLRLTWSRGDHHLDVTVRSDGLLEWFYDDLSRIGGEDGSNGEPVEALPLAFFQHLGTARP